MMDTLFFLSDANVIFYGIIASRTNQMCLCVIFIQLKQKQQQKWFYYTAAGHTLDDTNQQTKNIQYSLIFTMNCPRQQQIEKEKNRKKETFGLWFRIRSNAMNIRISILVHWPSADRLWRWSAFIWRRIELRIRWGPFYYVSIFYFPFFSVSVYRFVFSCSPFIHSHVGTNSQ